MHATHGSSRCRAFRCLLVVVAAVAGCAGEVPRGSVELVSVTPASGTELLFGSSVPFQVTLDYELSGVEVGILSVGLGLESGAGLRIREEEVAPGSGTMTLSGTVNVDHLHTHLEQYDTYDRVVYLEISIGYRESSSSVLLLQWTHLPDYYYPIVD